MKRIILLLCFLSVALGAYAQFNFGWVHSFNGSQSQPLSTNIATDIAGNMYMVGTFEGTRYFGNDTLVAIGSTDAFVAKYDNTGNFVWAKKFGGSISSTTTGNNICVDGTGNIYVCGNFTTNFLADTVWFYAVGNNPDIIVMKLNANGDIVTIKHFGGDQYDDAQGITCNSSGGVSVCGSFSYKITCDNDSVMSNGSDDIFIATFDSGLNILWLKNAGGANPDVASSVCSFGNSLYMTGTVIGTSGGMSCSFGSHNITAFYADVFTAKYDLANGTNLWVKRGGGPNNDQGNDIAVDQFGNVYVTGYCQGATQFLPFNVAAGNFFDAFTVKYDPSGTCLFASNAGCSSQQVIGKSIAVDPNGFVFTTGVFAGTTTFTTPSGPTLTLASTGLNDIFVARYNPQGVCKAVVKAGGTGDDIGTGICWSPSNEMIAVGNFNNSATFSSTNLTVHPGDAFASFIGQLPNSFTGISDIDFDAISFAYPNPAISDVVVAEKYLDGAKKVELINISGQTVIHQTGYLATISVAELPTGMYQLKISYKESFVSQKIQVIR